MLQRHTLLFGVVFDKLFIPQTWTSLQEESS